MADFGQTVKKDEKSGSGQNLDFAWRNAHISLISSVCNQNPAAETSVMILFHSRNKVITNFSLCTFGVNQNLEC